MSKEHVNWPDLPARGFLSGRLATQLDVEKGDAVFSTNGAGTVVSIVVSQYAYWRDEQNIRQPRILIQAEDAPNGLTVVGLRDFADGEAAATLAEADLLGTKKPN